MTDDLTKLKRLIGRQRSFICGDGRMHVELDEDRLWRCWHERHPLDIEDERFGSLEAAMEAIERVFVDFVWREAPRDIEARRAE